VEGEVIDTATLTAPTQPVVEAVVNAGSSTSALAAGSIISIYGRDLAVSERSPSAAVLELAGSSVTLNGQRLPLLYAAPHKINAQLPFEITGPALLQVNSRTSTETVAIEIAPYAPAVLQVQIGYRQYPSITRSGTNSLITPFAPASAGEYVTLYVIGLGVVEGSIAAGEVAPANPLLRVLNPVEVEIGAFSVAPSFVGLTPGYAGLYQINLRLPATLRAGATALRVVAAGKASDPVTLFVGPNAN
jgi:uncharacterized protein (TIGR03437 family)